MDMFKITTEVRALLLDNPNIVSLIEDEIFPVIAPESTEGDFIRRLSESGYTHTT